MDHFNQFIHQHWPLCVAFVIILVAIYIHEYLNAKKQGKTLSPEAVVNLINHQDAVVFDLRPKDVYQKGHIIHAIHATTHDFDLPKMDKHKSKPLILVCTRGIESTTLAAKLRDKGYQQPMVLSGGMTAWQTAGLPLVKK